MRPELNKYIWILFIIVLNVAMLPADSVPIGNAVDVRPESRLLIRCFNDSISNGVQDINESGISGWTFEIQGSGNKYTINTDENGKADIWLYPGTYRINELGRKGFETTSTNNQTVSLDAGREHTIYFGNKLINTPIKIIDSRHSTKDGLTYSGYPQIILMPESQTFTDSDWQQEHGKRIYITVENPDYSKLYNANIKINISDRWELIPNPEDSPICYISKEKTFWIHDFGNFTERYASDWFELRPRKGIKPKQYSLNAEIVIDYNHPDDDVTGSVVHESKSNKTINLLVIGSTNYLSILMNNFSWIIALIGLLFGTGLLRDYFKSKDI